ncbi:MAG: cytochrome c1 [Alphaproteobacteria bacterium]|nr:cytochrome c1 [Alphaproteobacteria bacterium]
MSRIAGLLIGPVLAAFVALGGAQPAAAAEGGQREPHAPSEGWSFDGFFGHFDRAELQRGFQIYKEVCSSCHAMKFVAIRTLSQPGGPGFSEPAVKSVASEFKVPAGPDEKDGSLVDDVGLLRQRPAVPSDHFVGPYANEYAARAANGGALPPDLSVIVKARHDGASYVYSLLQCYEEPPPEVQLQPGMHYNPCMAGGQIAMPAPLVADRVTYDDGTAATVEQMSKDVAAFLAWAAEPELEGRRKLGFMVLFYLGVLAILSYLAYRRVWRDTGH